MPAGRIPALLDCLYEAVREERLPMEAVLPLWEQEFTRHHEAAVQNSTCPNEWCSLCYEEHNIRTDWLGIEGQTLYEGYCALEYEEHEAEN